MGGTPSNSGTQAFLVLKSSIPQPPQPKQESTSLILPALMRLELEDEYSSCDENSLRCSSRSLTTSPSQRKVGFANVNVREYKVTVGDHPCCANGCPLTLDWEYQSEQVLSLDMYESIRAPRCHRKDLRTTWDERRRILSQDCSEGELRKAQRKLHRARSCDSRLCEKMTDSFFR